MFGSARDIAVQALRDRAGNVSGYLNYLLVRSRLDRNEKALASELAMGVVRRRGTLDAVIRAYLKQPGKRLAAPVGEILQVAIYQILFLDRVPDFAAVDEAVEQAATFHHKRQQGLVNGLLRAFLREKPEPWEGDPLSAKALNVVPANSEGGYKLGRDILSDPQQSPAEFLAEAYSLSPLLAGRWLERFGWDETARLAVHAFGRPPLIARVNTLRADPQQVLRSLDDSGISGQLHENDTSVVFKPAGAIGRLAVFTDGLIQPQDPTASEVSATVEVAEGMRVLDFCAAPGTKTTHLAELMNNRGSITAVDVTPQKLEKIQSNCRRLGIDIVETCLAEDIGGLDLRSFDLVLADVPCSNTGVLARRPEAKWRFNEESLDELNATQKSLAAAAAEYLKPAGRLVYSTCSIEPEECRQVAGWLDERIEDIRLVSEKTTIPAGEDSPQKWHDGGYVAVFERK